MKNSCRMSLNILEVPQFWNTKPGILHYFQPVKNPMKNLSACIHTQQMHSSFCIDTGWRHVTCYEFCSHGSHCLPDIVIWAINDHSKLINRDPHLGQSPVYCQALYAGCKPIQIAHDKWMKWKTFIFKVVIQLCVSPRLSSI
jgi:hypothetical protein